MKSYGINPQNGSLMFPCTEELAQTLALGHGGGVLHQMEEPGGSRPRVLTHTTDGIRLRLQRHVKPSVLDRQVREMTRQ